MRLVLPLICLLCYKVNRLSCTQRSYVVEEENATRTTSLLIETESGVYEIEDLTTVNEDELSVSEEDIIYYFYTRSNQNGTAVNKITTDIVSLSGFDANNEILVLIHGWTNDYTSDFNTLVRSAALDTYDLNVIVVDWSSFSKKDYITAKDVVPNVGKLVAQFLQSVTSKYNIPMSLISIVGHSLGAHISGVASTALDGDVNYIVGLDPAGPLISILDKKYILDVSDAPFVQVIHTNGGLLGLMSSLGHADYFPNGGTIQPGCGLDYTGSCSHSRSYRYYAESIRENKFVSQQCDSYFRYKLLCSGRISLMGGYIIDQTASNDYYLDTNSDTPYGMS